MGGVEINLEANEECVWKKKGPNLSREWFRFVLVNEMMGWAVSCLAQERLLLGLMGGAGAWGELLWFVPSAASLGAGPQPEGPAGVTPARGSGAASTPPLAHPRGSPRHL